MKAAVDFQTRALRAMSADENVRVSQALWEESWEVPAAGVEYMVTGGLAANV